MYVADIGNYINVTSQIPLKVVITSVALSVLDYSDPERVFGV